MKRPVLLVACKVESRLNPFGFFNLHLDAGYFQNLHLFVLSISCGFSFSYP